MKKKLKINALKYLTGKQRIKGKNIKYSKITMSEYLLPTNKNLTIEEKRRMFAVRNKMTNIPPNFQKSRTEIECSCGEIETMEHIYECESYNIDKSKISYEKIYSGNINEQMEVLKIM